MCCHMLRFTELQKVETIFNSVSSGQTNRLVEYSAEHQDGMFQVLLLVGCANALAYNVVHYLMIQRTSAVTTTVLGEIKIVGLLMLSAVLLGESPGQSFVTQQC